MDETRWMHTTHETDVLWEMLKGDSWETQT